MNLRKDIEKSEKKFEQIVKFRYRNLDNKIQKQLILDDVLIKFDILRFHDIYLKNTIYPLDRLNSLCLLLLDIKMEIGYIYFDILASSGLLSLMNKTPYHEFKLLSFDQSLIVKSRILWERVMNFLYFLETGEELKSKSKDRSKRTIFFESINQNIWKFLSVYKDYIDWFDNHLRSPEVHHGSFLRKIFTNSKDLSDNERNKILGLLNLVQNTIYLNVISVLLKKGINNYYWNDSFGKDPFNIKPNIMVQ